MSQTSPPSAPSPAPDDRESPSAFRAAGVMLFGILGALLATQTILETSTFARNLVSADVWNAIVDRLGGRRDHSFADPSEVSTVALPTLTVWSLGGLTILAFWVGGAWAEAGWRSSRPRPWAAWGHRLGLTLWIPTAWFVVWLMTADSGLLDSSVDLLLAITAATGVTAWWMLARPETGSLPIRRPARILAGGILAYCLIWVTMNFGLWNNLQIPHGDSAMYEEHLWNLEHGKGFRSYLDQGVFLGEHIQVIHLLFIPLHLLWPSHLVLELGQSTILALGAIPVYHLARRHSGQERAALLLAGAYLCSFPLHYLDIAFDLKTFRPNALGIPPFLCGLDNLEQGRWKRMFAWFFLALSAQEDFAIPLATVGTWLLLSAVSTRFAWRRRWFGEPVPGAVAGVWTPRFIGLGLALGGTIYVFSVVKFVLPWFRQGVDIHYLNYFSKLGATPTEILRTLLTRPGLVFGEIFKQSSLMWALYLLIPLGGIPLWSPGRLLCGAPLFLILCFNDLAQNPAAPVHHFHGSLLPILFWAAAGSLRPTSTSVRWRPRFALCCAVSTACLIGISPLSVRFWDPGSAFYWRTLYVPSERAEHFAAVDAAIPRTARVASTDFIHPRFTHCDRSYDYSSYLRKTSDFQATVPTDTDYLVIDTRHRYSPTEGFDLTSAEQIREYREHADDWEILNIDPAGYFLVLKRRRPAQ